MKVNLISDQWSEALEFRDELANDCISQGHGRILEVFQV